MDYCLDLFTKAIFRIANVCYKLEYLLNLLTVQHNKLIQMIHIQTITIKNQQKNYLGPKQKTYFFQQIQKFSISKTIMQASLAKTTQQWMNNLSLYDKKKQQGTKQLQDPFITDGGSIVYNQQHDFVIRMQQKPNQVQTLKNMQTIRVKIMMVDLHGICKNIKIQLTSDTELYFNFIFTCSDWEFKRIKQNQNLFIDFKDYPEVIIKGFHKLKNSVQDAKYLSIFTVFTEKQGRLDIIRKAQFRDDTILEFDFFKASQQQLKESIQYRFDLMREQKIIYTQKYEEITESIKAKNPSLMMQITKGMKKGK